MRKSICMAWLAACLLPACSGVQGTHERPAPVLPEAWNVPQDASRSSMAGERWWELFADPVLDTLVDEAMQHNHEIEAAAGRILEAEAAMGITDADRYPVVGINANASRSGLSTVDAMPLYPGMPRIQNNLHLAVDASYELDIWGKFRHASAAARAQLLAAQAAQDTVRLTLTSEVAQQYFNLLALDAQVAVVRDVLQSRIDTVDLLRLRFESGVGSEYEIRQAEAEQSAVASQLASTLKARENLESALAILLGRSPRDVMQGNVERGSVAPMEALWVPDGLPSALLLRRPDIREAEQKLRAEDAKIEVARTEFFPAISLTSYLGTESANLANLFTGPAGIFQFMLGLSQPIFNGNRLDYSVKAAEARRVQAVADYQKAVANAFGDVRNALNAQAAGRDVLKAESARIGALLEAQRLASVRYQGGVSGRLEVLDADRQLLQAQLAGIDAENAQRVAVVSLFKALGGGWKSAGDEPAAASR
jgi:outer membrane protein, multidrug efflux system